MSLSDFLNSADYMTEVGNIVSSFNLQFSSETVLGDKIAQFIQNNISEQEMIRILDEDLLIENNKIPLVLATIKVRMYHFIDKEVDQETLDIFNGRQQAIKTEEDEQLETEETPVNSAETSLDNTTQEGVGEKETELMIAPELEPMIIEQPIKKPVPIKIYPPKKLPVTPVNLPVESASVVAEKPKTPVVEAQPIAPTVTLESNTDLFNRHDILSDIENPAPTVFTSPQTTTKPVATPKQQAEPTLKNPGTPLYEQKLNQAVRLPRQEQKITDPYRESVE